MSIRVLRELKSLSSPPKLVKDVFSPVAILMGVKDPGEWATHLKMMSNPASLL